MNTPRHLRAIAAQLDACYFEGWNLTLLADSVALLLRAEADRISKLRKPKREGRR